TTGNLVEENFKVKGGEIICPDHSCGINFSGFNGIVEFAWKATAYSHLTLLSNTPSKSLHTHMGISFQLPKKPPAALEKTKQNVYAKDPDKSH
ncbi:hypothetical protein VP01_7805g1, partial [Puccinia sorghi]